jgi:hypothetical protein
MEKDIQVKLSNGVLVVCRPVPPYALMPLYEAFSEPEMPMEVIETISGVEKKRPLPKSETWQKYQQAIKDHRRKLNVEVIKYHFNLGVISWELPDGEVQSQPPVEWQLPLAMQQYVTTEMNEFDRRAAYIMYELMAREEDVDAVETAIGMRKSTPISNQEVEAAATPFVSVAETKKSSRPKAKAR